MKFNRGDRVKLAKRGVTWTVEAVQTTLPGHPELVYLERGPYANGRWIHRQAPSTSLMPA